MSPQLQELDEWFPLEEDIQFRSPFIGEDCGPASSEETQIAIEEFERSGFVWGENAKQSELDEEERKRLIGVKIQEADNQIRREKWLAKMKTQVGDRQLGFHNRNQAKGRISTPGYYRSGFRCNRSWMLEVSSERATRISDRIRNMGMEQCDVGFFLKNEGRVRGVAFRTAPRNRYWVLTFLA